MDKLKNLIIDRLDISVAKFCKKVKVSRPTIDNILLGRNKHEPRLDTVKKICKYFKVNFRDYV